MVRLASLKVKHLIFLLIFILIILQVIYMYMINIIEKPYVNDVTELVDTTRVNKLIVYLRNVENNLRDIDIIDSSGSYRIFPRFTRENTNKSFNLTLVTHSSTHSLLQIVEQSKSWDGSISVAVFTVYRHLLTTLTLIVYLTTCVESIRGRTDFHLVLPLNPHRFNYSLEYLYNFKFNCDSNDVLNLLYEDIRNYALDNNAPYPNNLLRNIAIKYAWTDYIMMLDIDLLPSKSLHREFVKFLAKSHFVNNTLYILPVFEIKAGLPMPRTKMELVSSVHKGDIRQFYVEVCEKCHSPLNYQRWLSEHYGASSSELNVMHDAVWKDPWEPYYIGKRPFPLYDERFLQYGFNRISQACELHVAGYKMVVLDNAFVVHQGFKRPGQFHATKDEEQERNRKLFRTFKEGLKIKYPQSTNRC